MFILDAELNTIYSNSKLENEVDLKAVSELIGQKKDGKVKINGTEYIVISQEISPIGWYAVAINSKKQMTKEAVNSLNTNGLFAVLFLIVGVIISIWVIQKYLNPLYRTIDVMQEAKSGDLNVRAQEESTYEIRVLNETFNQMIVQIQNMFETEKDMTRRIYETELLQKEALMESLYHQIQPHFLYNTLNSRSILIKCDRRDDAVKAIEELSVLMRGVTNSNQDVSIEEELNITESYMKLQKLRQEALEYIIQVGEECKKLRIPALSIQPLVENALIHGFEEVIGDKLVTIEISAIDDFIEIKVSDNGVGISEEQMASINNELADPISEKEDSRSGRGWIPSTPSLPSGATTAAWCSTPRTARA